MAAGANLWARLGAHLPLNIVQAGVGFGALALFSHMLDPDDFGRYALVLSTMALAHTLAFTWIEGAAFRFHAEAKNGPALGDHFATLLALGGLASVIAGGVTFAALAFAELSQEMFFAAALAALATFARFISRIARESERADHQVVRYSVMEGLYLAGGFAIAAAAIVGFDFGPVGPFLGLAAMGCALAMADIARLLKNARGGRATPHQAIRYASYGAPLALALVLDLAAQTATRFALEASSGPTAVGAYAAGYGLAGRLLDLVFLWAGLAAAPLTLTAFQSEGQAGAKAAAQKAFAALFALAAPAAVGLALVGPELAHIMIGPGLRTETIATLPWFAASGLMSGLTLYYFCEAFTLSRRTGLRALLMIAPAISAIALTFAWAPQHGALGAVWALTISSGLGLLLIAGVGRGVFALPVSRAVLWKVGIAVLAMGAAVHATPSLNNPFATLIAKAACGAVVYISLLFALDFSGIRSTASAVWQRIHAKLSSRAVEAQP